MERDYDVIEDGPEQDKCPHGHGYQDVVGGGYNGGFAGEGVWWTNLACGHQIFETGEVV